MIRKKLFRGIPFCLALGLMITPAVAAHAEAYGTGLTKSIESADIDPGFMIKPEVFVNSEAVSADDVKILNSGAYLPLETIAFKMGDRLEGSAEDSYMLRKADKMLIMNVTEDTYILNGTKNNVKFEVVNNVAYAPITFFKDVLGYDMNFVGNEIRIGEKEDVNADTTVNEAGNVNLSADMLIDGAMMLKQEIYINSERYPDFGVQVVDGKTYLPLEVVTEKMGDRLEGDISTSYTLRKNNMMLVVDFNESTYVLNGQAKKADMKFLGGKVYVSLDFFKNVLNYEMKEDGNSVFIGEIKAKETLSNTIANGKWNLENGSWYYLNGESKVTGWVRDNNNWYYLNDNGTMATGWVKLNNNWYLLNNDGTMATGWVLDKDNYYYLNKDGVMASNTVVDGFSLAENGVAISLY